MVTNTLSCLAAASTDIPVMRIVMFHVVFVEIVTGIAIGVVLAATDAEGRLAAGSFMLLKAADIGVAV